MLAPRKKLWSTPDAVIDRVVQMVGPLLSTDKIVDLGCGDGKVLVRWAEMYSSSFHIESHHCDVCDDEPSEVEDGSFAKSVSISHREFQSLQESVVNDISSRKSKQPQHPTFVGIDIDPDRIYNARNAWDSAVHVSRRLPLDIPHEFHVVNAVFNDQPWNDISTTILYVYLTPRGMKLLKRQILGKQRIPDQGTNYPFIENCRDAICDPCMNDPSCNRRQRRIIVSYMNPLPEAKLLRKEYVSIPNQPDTSYPIYMYEW